GGDRVPDGRRPRPPAAREAGTGGASDRDGEGGRLPVRDEGVTVARGWPWTASLAARLTLALLVAPAPRTRAMGRYGARAIAPRGVAEVETRLQTQAWLLRDTLGPAVALRSPTLQAVARSYGQGLGARVTVIAADGTVLADSERDDAGVRAME